MLFFTSNSPCHGIKRPGKLHFCLAGKAYLRKADACKSQQKVINISTVYYIIFNFLKSKNVFEGTLCTYPSH